MKKFYFLLITLFCLSATSLRAQVTFTQTSNDDFTQGNSYGTVINNNAVVPEPSLVGGTLNDWEATTNIPATLYGHQLCTWRNYLYCIGGHNGSSVVNTVYRATFQNSGASNVGISGWTTLTALPVSLRDAAVVSTQNYLIVIGGHNADSICRNIYTAKFNSDGSVAGWSVSPVSLPQPMYGMRAVVAQGNLYIIGGTTSDNASGCSNKVYLGKVNALGELYELTETVTLPVALNRHAVATDGQYVYVTGGQNSSGTRLNSVLKATLNPDGTVNGWQVMAALPAETDGHSAVCSNGVLAVIGGEDNTGLASNKLYYTSTNGNAFNWNIADVFLSDRVKNAASVAYRSSIYVAGGVNMVGTILNYTRYAPITGSSQVTDATFISTPFLIGDPKTIQGLSYTLSNDTTDYQLLYRVAGMDKVYSNWTSTDNSNPLNINISGSFLQYMMRFTSSTGTQPTLEDMTLTLSGITQLNGNLNGMDTLKVENSPYWATGSISFTDGTHVIDSGVTIYFSPNTGLNITRANMKFNGTANAGITLTSYDHEVPNWNGVYFQDASDNGVSSIMNYTSIMYAGNGDNNANLRLYNTNQPVISHCNFQHADGHGLRLVNSHPTLSNCTFSYNTESGVYMEGANPTLNTATCDGNGFAGLYYANANVNPNLTDITLQNNLYGIYSHTPDNSFAHSGSIAMSGNGTDVAVNGGNIYGDHRWGYFENGYALLSDVTIRGKLTIAPGNTLKMAQGKYLNIGWGGSEGGKLSAMGKADSLITFTSLNGAVGGWEGLFFRDGSDYNSSSTLRYCVVENGNDRNLYCENTTQPYILSCTFRNANNQDMRLHNSNITVESSILQTAKYGLNLYNSSPILISDTFELISRSCLRMETNNWPNLYSIVMRNSKYGIELPNPNYDIPHLESVVYSNNVANFAINGGDISSNKTWECNTYSILGSICVAGANSTPHFSIKPGSTLKFAPNTGLQIGDQRCPRYCDYYGGALYAIGTPDSLITFTALNDSIGGWNGIYFHNFSDNYGTENSDVKYCIIEKGKDYNLYTNNTRMPNIENSTFRLSDGHGLWINGEYAQHIRNSVFEENGTDGLWNQNCVIKIHDSQFINNGRYGLHYNNSYYVDTLINLTISGNNLDGIVIDGGSIEENRTWFYCEKPYIALRSIFLRGATNIPCLTIKPGTILKFANNTGFQIGEELSWANTMVHSGTINAIGKPDSLITFSALNDSIGGWNGIYFHDYSDNRGGECYMTYVDVSQGKDYNVRSVSTTFPTMENCNIHHALGNGLQLESSPCAIKSSAFHDNSIDGFYNKNSLVTIRSSQFNDNGRYGLHYNNSYYVDSLTNLSFSNNNIDGIIIDGGTIEDNRTWFYCEKPYIVLDNIYLRGYTNIPCLTLKPGVSIKFANDKGMQVGDYFYWSSQYLHSGTLNAIGTPDSLITFSALNDSIGGWNGIYFNPYSDDRGGECYLTYVDISQGKSYNIRTNQTNFPTMEKCNIHHSLGNGMQIESSNCVINSSSFHHNGNHGLFINGGNQPTIGGNYMTYCSFYNNQGYDVYQDGNQTINMPYSFFGCTDSLMVTTKKIYDKSDNSSKGEVKYWPVSWVPQSIGEDLQLDGTITYGEDGLMNNVTVSIQDFMNNNLLQTTVGATSDFHFSDVNLTTANRMVFEHPYSYADGAVNATDALRVMRHFTHQSLLTLEQQVAADVNGSCTVNGTDAMLILKRYVGLLEEFPVGNCLYICDSVIANDNNFTYNTQMYWYGDVDFSYNFTRGDNSTVQLETYNTAYIPQKNETIRIPVIAKGNYSLGAISLDILYPETEMEIVGVELYQTGDPMTFHTHDNSLRIGWYSLSPLAVSYDDTLLYITARVLQNNPDIRFELGPCCALADGYAEPISGAVLAMPNISDILGVEDIQGGNSESVWEQVQVYPNPSHGTFTISDPEHVIQNLYLYDVCGKLVEIGSSYASESSIRISNLTPGVYFIRMEAEDSTKTLKVVVEK